jgi:hypothetical protein
MIKQLATNCPTLFHEEIEKEGKLLLAILDNDFTESLK